MATPDDAQEHEEVSTEAQRQALDAMSRQLVENLNAMIREQNERAERFAATQHSVSALPGQAGLPEIKPLDLPDPAPLPTMPPPPAQATPKPRHQAQSPSPAQAKAQAKKLPPRPTQPLDNGEPQTLPQRPRIKMPTGKGQQEQQGCGATSVIVAIVIVLMLLRACG